MSGIAGIYHTDGRPADGEVLERMIGALAHRGPDGRGSWLEGAVGLGHRMFHETPESLREQQPCVDQNRQLALTADARIDNREDLIQQLGLSAEDPLLLPDSRLILLAYARWGEDCVDRLLGDFAFALWDGRGHSLFCARDIVGAKPFYYAFRKNQFLFASELKALLCLKDISHELNEEMIARYLALDVEDDKEITFYKGLLRLPAAQTMRVDSHGLHPRCYWQPDSKRELRLKSNREYADVFRETFAESVKCRLRSAFPVGSTLSGGLDSSSITCMARDLLLREGRGRQLKTFSATFDYLPKVSEKAYQDAVIAVGGIESYKVPMDQLGPLEAYMDGQRHMEYPYPGSTYYLHRGLYQQMRNQGVRICLDGHGGDGVVSHGVGFLRELARTLHLLRLSMECRAFARIHDIPVSRVLWQLGFRPNVPPLLINLWRLIRYRGIQKKPPLLGNLPIAPGLLQRTAVLERARKENLRESQFTALRTSHAQLFAGNSFPSTLETSDQLSYANSLVTRFPFLDRRLIELCLSLPHDQKLNQGWTRMILRRAMEGILPAEVQWRPGKSDLGPHFFRMLLGKERSLLLQLLTKFPARLTEYVDVNKHMNLCMKLLSNEGRAVQLWEATWPAVSLGIWLQGACDNV